MFEMSGSCVAQPDQIPFPNADKWYLLPVLESTQKFNGKMEKKIIGLMLLETERENEHRRIGRFETLGDEALKLLTRPTYPFEKAQKEKEGTVYRLEGSSPRRHLVGHSRGIRGLKV
jgi:hypothetical protein